MNFCKKCGNKIEETAKFCTNCGTPNTSDDTLETQEQENNINNNFKVKINNANITKNKTAKSSKLKIIIPIIAMIIIGIVGGIVYFKTTTIERQKLKQSIEILNLDATNYPNIVVSIKANNYSKDLNVKRFTLKENDTFQKDLKLSNGLEANEYKVEYKTSDESSSGERNIKIAYLQDDIESIADISYKAPEKPKNKISEKLENKASNNNSNNTVGTYDDNELKIKSAIDNYEKSYISMINSKNINYIKSDVDSSGGLITEFENLIKSYSQQNITEDLMEYRIEDIKKIQDNQYEVTNYEKFYISYGKEKKSSYTEFRTSYVVKNTSSGFKVYSIKNVETLGSKSNK